MTRLTTKNMWTHRPGNITSLWAWSGPGLGLALPWPWAWAWASPWQWSGPGWAWAWRPFPLPFSLLFRGKERKEKPSGRAEWRTEQVIRPSLAPSPLASEIKEGERAEEKTEFNLVQLILTGPRPRQDPGPVVQERPRRQFQIN